MDIKRIRSFIAIAEHNSFRGAAESLGLSPPALSAHIASLEKELKVPLVSRTTRTLRLTPIGERLLIRARRALDELQTAVLELQDEAALQRGRLVVASTPILSANRIPPVVQAFKKKCPAITVELWDDTAPAVERHVANGLADIAIAPMPERNQTIGSWPLIKDQFVLISRANGPLSGRQRIGLKEIAAQPMIAMHRDSSIRRIVDQAFTHAGIDYTPIMEIRHHHTVVGLVQAGVGCAVLPETGIPHFGTAKLNILPVSPSISRNIGILYRRGESLGPAAKTFVDMLRISFRRSFQDS